MPFGHVQQEGRDSFCCVLPAKQKEMFLCPYEALEDQREQPLRQVVSRTLTDSLQTRLAKRFGEEVVAAVALEAEHLAR